MVNIYEDDIFQNSFSCNYLKEYFPQDTDPLQEAFVVGPYSWIVYTGKMQGFLYPDLPLVRFGGMWINLT